MAALARDVQERDAWSQRARLLAQRVRLDAAVALYIPDGVQSAAQSCAALEVAAEPRQPAAQLGALELAVQLQLEPKEQPEPAAQPLPLELAVPRDAAELQLVVQTESRSSLLERLASRLEARPLRAALPVRALALSPQESQALRAAESVSPPEAQPRASQRSEAQLDGPVSLPLPSAA